MGNPNNPPDQLYVDAVHNPNNLRFGSVANIYRISKYEVTNDQYTEFLNAVDPMGTNPNSVYFFRMGSDPRGGIAFQRRSGERVEVFLQDQHEQQACQLRVVL